MNELCARDVSRLRCSSYVGILCVLSSLLLLSNRLDATPPQGYQLTWNDEFDGNQLDESSWWYRADEKQQSIQLPSNVEVDNGELVLNLTPLASPINGFDAAGAGVISQQRFHYGYYETRGKLGDGINDDFDSATDEGWHHAFWAMAAEADANGHVLTTFPSFRRTEIDGFENGSSVNLGRMSQHVLVWNDAGRITHKLPSSDITVNPPGTEFDWHTYGFEWTPREVRFYVDNQLTKTAVYPVEQFEHDQINLWLTAISTNNESSDQERSEARYDYFRFYERGNIDVQSGEQLAAGVHTDVSAPVGGTFTQPGFGTTSVPATGGVAGNVTIQSGGSLYGAGWVYGDVVAQSGGVLRVGNTGSGIQGAPTSAVTSIEDFESFTPGVAFENGISTGLTPNWTYYDLGNLGDSFTDTVWEISGADGTASEPTDAALTGESQMLFQTNANIDFANESSGGEPFAGAVAITDQFDTSGSVDIIEADFVFDGYGDDGGQNLDSKIVFGFRDIDNWFALSLVAGNSTGSSTRIDVSANVDGDRQNVFSASGTGSFTGNFPEDTLLHARVEHDASLGFVSFSISDLLTGDILAEGFTMDDRFKFDGDVGLAVNNDATGIDNLIVTTQDSLALSSVQDLEVLGSVVMNPGATLEIDIDSSSAYDRLFSTGGSIALEGTLDASLVSLGNLQLGDVLTIISAENGVTGQFAEIYLPALPGDLNFMVHYLENSVELEVVQGSDADFNYDGVVDGSDLARWRDTLGASRGADANQDGMVSSLDFLAWQRDLGFSVTTSVVTTIAAVPEPGGIVLLVVGALMSCLTRKVI